MRTNRKTFLFVLLILFIWCNFHLVSAQETNNPVDLWDFTQKSITIQDVFDDIKLIAHIALIGRGTGSSGYDFAALFLVRELRKYGLEPIGDVVGDNRSFLQGFFVETIVEIEYGKKYEKKIFTSNNILGFIEGSERKDEFIIIGAHYDHLGIDGGEIYPGADDNGSGTCGVLEIAEALGELRKLGIKPKRSILIAFWGSEELGLLGSKYFVKHLPLEIDANKIALLINLDMIGRNESKKISIGTGEGKDFATIRSYLFKILTEANQNIGFDISYGGIGSGNSDHYPFYKMNSNISILNFFSGFHGDYHEPSDTWDKINYEKVRNVARLVFLIIWRWADMGNE